MSEKPETHRHPKPIHDQKSGNVKISPSQSANRYDLVLKNSVGGILDEVSKGPIEAFTVLDSVNTFGATKPVTLSTGLATTVESSQIAVISYINEVIDPELHQIAGTLTAPRSFLMVLQPPQVPPQVPPQLPLNLLEGFTTPSPASPNATPTGSPITSFNFKTGDMLSIMGEAGPLDFQIRIFSGKDIVSTNFTISQTGRASVDFPQGVPAQFTFTQDPGYFQVVLESGQQTGDFLMDINIKKTFFQN